MRLTGHLRSGAGLLLVLLAACLAPRAAQGQRVEFHGRGDAQLDERIRDILEAGTHTMVVRDTLLALGDTLPGHVMIVGATVRIEGVVAGDLVMVDANVFLRPPARVLGGVLNIAGGYYPSAQATVLGDVEDFPNAPYDVVYGPDVRRIVGTRRRALFRPDGFRGLREPSYDRVHGLTLGIGATYLLPLLGPVEPFVHAFGEYESRPGEFGGGAELGAVRGGLTFAAGAERVTRTNEDWIRGSLYNSFAFLILGNDYRNYYRADSYYARIEYARESPVLDWLLAARAEFEDATSLSAGDPWTLFDPDSVRPNPAVGGTEIASVTIGSELVWRRSNFFADVAAEVEVGVNAFGGDHDFGRFEIDARWATPAIADHTLELETFFQTPLPGTDVLPPQRRTFVGGAGTLWTHQIGAFPGDRAVLIATNYIIPLPRPFAMPVFGPLAIELLHRAGTAWTREASPDFEQNVGLRLATPIAWARVATDPADFGEDIEFGIGLRLPRSYPWSSRAPE